MCDKANKDSINLYIYLAYLYSTWNLYGLCNAQFQDKLLSLPHTYKSVKLTIAKKTVEMADGHCMEHDGYS